MSETAQATDGPGTDTDADVAGSLVQLAALVQAIYARVAERHDLTPVQARLLCRLLDGPQGMAELAHCFGVEKAALTGLMDRAERRGLARRSPVPGDRRALQVTLTDPGHQTAAAFHAELGAQLSGLISSLAPQDREHFRNTMAEIIARYRTCLPDHCLPQCGASCGEVSGAGADVLPGCVAGDPRRADRGAGRQGRA